MNTCGLVYRVYELGIVLLCVLVSFQFALLWWSVARIAWLKGRIGELKEVEND